MDDNLQPNDRNSKNFKGAEISPSLEGINMLVIPLHLFEAARCPESTLNLLHNILTLPQEFGVSKIFLALKLVKPEIKKLPGMVKVHDVHFLAECPDLNMQGFYKFSFHPSVYDKQAITSAELTCQAFLLDPESDFSTATAEAIRNYYEKVEGKNYLNELATVALRPSEKISIDREVADRCCIKISNAGGNYCYNAPQIFPKSAITGSLPSEDKPQLIVKNYHSGCEYRIFPVKESPINVEWKMLGDKSQAIFLEDVLKLTSVKVHITDRSLVIENIGDAFLTASIHDLSKTSIH